MPLVFLEVGDRTLAVAVPDDLSSAVQRLFPALVAAAPTDAVPDVLVERNAGRLSITSDRGTSTIDAADDDLLGELEHELALALLDRLGNFAHIHAAGCSIAGRGLLALGRSGAGKSTLALNWSLAGHPLLGDDVVLLDAGGLAHAFPRLPGVDPAALERAGVDPADTLFWEDESNIAWFDPARGGGWVAACRPRVIALVEFDPAREPALAEVEPARMLSIVLASLLPSGRPAASMFDALLSLVRECRCVSLVHSDSAGAARQLVEMLS